MDLLKKLSPYFAIKGLLLAIVYFTLAVYAVFFVPRTVPAESQLQTIRLTDSEVKLNYNKKSNTSYFTGIYKDIEFRTITLKFKEGLKLYGTNEFFLQMKSRPKYYDLKIHKDKLLFGERYKVYELSDDAEVLIPYERSAEIIQNMRNKFFLLGLGILALFGFILIKTLIQKIKEIKK